MTFDDAIQKNIPQAQGISPLNSGVWLGLLTDLAESTYKWNSPVLDWYDRLLIEKYIVQRQDFAIVKTKYRKGNAYIQSRYRVLRCFPEDRGARNEVIKIRIVMEKPPKNLVMDYVLGEFVYFDNFSNVHPMSLVRKYAEILGKLDALYEQNIDKLSMPIIALVDKGQKNEFLNLFKRTLNNALFTLFNSKNTHGSQETANNLFYNPQVDFNLDKLNVERKTVMEEFMRNWGVNPADKSSEKGQYVNNASIRDASLVAKYFAAAYNKYRDNFREKNNVIFPDLELNYEQTVKMEVEIGDSKSNEGIGDNSNSAILNN